MFGTGCWGLALYMLWCALYSHRGYYSFVSSHAELQKLHTHLDDLKKHCSRLAQENYLIRQGDPDVLEEALWKVFKRCESSTLVLHVEATSGEENHVSFSQS